jgi:hypothetical protein
MRHDSARTRIVAPKPTIGGRENEVKRIKSMASINHIITVDKLFMNNCNESLLMRLDKIS